MLNRKSPKKQSLDINMFNYPDQDFIIDKIIQSQKIHIKGQVENGANIIQIFDSWAGLLEEDKYERYIYEPTKKIVDYAKTLGVEVICFPRGIKKYAEFCKIINPSAINIDYETDPKKIAEQINIPIQGGIDPKSLLFEEGDMIKEAKKYLDIFKNHQYIFNLGHGILPETSPDNVKALVNFVKDYK